MFYEEQNPDTFLRFGDVISGFQLLKANFKSLHENSHTYSVGIEHYNYLVVLTPCCNIEKEELTVTPLLKIYPSLLK